MPGDGYVNDQITDSITQSIGAVVGSSPSETKSMLDTLMAETVGMAMYNAVTNQHNVQLVSNASVIAACARMLKAPTASSLPYRAIPPVIVSVTPTPIPLSSASQNVQCTGTGFQPGLTVTVYGPTDSVLALLGGSAQITVNSPTSLTITTDVFTTAGVFNLQIQNPDIGAQIGGASNLFQVTVQAAAPKIDSVEPLDASTYRVSGQHFQKESDLQFFDSEDKPIAGVTVSAITPGGIQFTMPAFAPKGPYSVQVTNPCGRSSKKLFVGISTPAQPTAPAPCPPPD